MFGPVLSVLLMGMVPAWGTQQSAPPLPRVLHVAPPALDARLLAGERLASLSASGAVVMDLDSGQVLFAHAADTARPMASLTKLMTALLIVEGHALDETVTVPSDIAAVEGNVAYLPPGERFSVGDLLSALLIRSANDAAVTLAQFHSGSVEAFVREMNDRARVLGLTQTSYQNPAGFDAPTQRSTPRELAWLATYVLTEPAIAERMALSSAQIAGSRGSTITLTNTHALLRAADASAGNAAAIVRAGKTGTTDDAGQCLLSIIEAGGRRYVSVFLHSADRYADMRQVLASLPQ